MSRNLGKRSGALIRGVLRATRFIDVLYRKLEGKVSTFSARRSRLICYYGIGADAANLASKRNLRELQLIGGTLQPAVFASIESLTKLRKLLLRNINVADDAGSLDFLSNMPNLEELTIENCESLLSGSFRPLSLNPNLRRLSIGMTNLDPMNFSFLARCSADLNLTICGQRDVSSLEWMTEVGNLTELTFKDFGVSEFPSWVFHLARLNSLSFLNGSLVGHSEDVPVIPESLERVTMRCNVAPPLFHNFWKWNADFPRVKMALPTLPSAHLA